jgi:hypothetical protein
VGSNGHNVSVFWSRECNAIVQPLVRRNPAGIAASEHQEEKRCPKPGGEPGNDIVQFHIEEGTD